MKRKDKRNKDQSKVEKEGRHIESWNAYRIRILLLNKTEKNHQQNQERKYAYIHHTKEKVMHNKWYHFKTGSHYSEIPPQKKKQSTNLGKNFNPRNNNIL